MPTKPQIATPRYSFVIPVYNEEVMLPALVDHLEGFLPKLDAPAEVIFVNDGSHDASWDLLEDYIEQRPWARAINLSRNFSQNMAITAGLSRASGEAIIIMDADLQDPPEVVLEMIERWKEGYDIVYAVRTKREGEPWVKRATSKMFYRIIRAMANVRLAIDVGDFRLISRRVAKVYLSMPETDRYLRGMFDWMGFSQMPVPFERHARAAGTTKYTLRKQFGLAFSAILNFSDAPLRMIVWLGFVFALLALGGAFWVIIDWLHSSTGYVVGWTSLIVAMGVLMSMNILMLGIVGLYVGRILDQVRGRPLFLIDKELGFPPSPPSTRTSHGNTP